MSAYDRIARLYDPWSRSVVEDVAVLRRARRRSPAARCSSSASAPAGSRSRSRPPGIRVIGVDSSPGMLEVARERGGARRRRRSTCAYGDFRDPPVEGTFPLVTIPFRSLLHMETDADRRAVAPRGAPAARSRAAASCSTSSSPAPTTSPRRTARWLEREPGIFERADWDERAPHADPARARRRTPRRS